MNPETLLALAGCVAPAVAGAAPPPAARAEPVPVERPLVRPGQLDLRLQGASSLLPLNVEAGVVAEVGALRVGAGTLTVGAEVGVNQCALECLIPNLVLERDVLRQDRHAVGRLGYHFPVANRNYLKADVYGVVLGGVMQARSSVDAPAYAHEGRGWGPVLGVGMGGNYFPSSRFFVGGEARLRLAAGEYGFTVTRGDYAFSQREARWIRAGVSTAFFVGFRLF